MFGSRFPYVKECSPCRTCYCDVKCERYGDCCLDRIIDVHLLDTYVNETKAYTDLTYAECMDLRVKGIYLKNFDVMQKQTLINKCPAEFNDSVIRSECEDVGPINANLLHLSTTPEDLSKNWPVSSTKSSLYYKNYACAKCHSDGAKNTTVFWSLDLSCQTFPNLPASSDPRSLLSVLLKDKECKVAFRTPENMEPRKCNVLPMVKSEVIDQCNATGKRSLYDAVLWKACDVFSIPMRQFTKYFANTFCARCQTDSKNSLSSTCSSDGMFPFFIVLSPDALDTVQQAHQSYDCRCRKGYIYNPFKLANEVKSAFVEKANRFQKDHLAHSVISFVVHANQVTEMNQNFTLSFYAKIKTNYPAKQEEFEKHLLLLQDQIWSISLPDTNVQLDFAATAIQKPNEVEVDRLHLDKVFIGKISESSEVKRLSFLSALRNSFRATNHDSKTIYLEVKNTLVCPHFIHKVTNTTEVKLEQRNDLQWPHVKYELVHIATGVKLPTVDFTNTNDGLVIFCIHQIMERMKSEYNKNVGGVDGVSVFGFGLIVTSYLCLGTSAVCLAFTLLTYYLFPCLRSLPGKSTMCLVTALLQTIILFFVGGFLEESSLACQIVGVLTHFFLLSAFMWMLVCTVHMYSVFSNIMVHTSTTIYEGINRFAFYMMLSTFVPGLIVTSTISANYFLYDSSYSYRAEEPPHKYNSDPEEIDTEFFSCTSNNTVRIGYGHGICYLSNKMSLLLAGALPIAFLCVTNLIIFILTLLALRRLSDHEKTARREARDHLLIYLKLSTLTGINWLPCTAAAFVSSSFVWYSFLILCGLQELFEKATSLKSLHVIIISHVNYICFQGLYIFISFVCNKRVLNLYKQRFLARESHTASNNQRRQDHGNINGGRLQQLADENSPHNTDSTNSHDSEPKAITC
ncbi:myosin-10 [Plakobranchus ocellatus]|uniref:Myosin-10 n=1 Tax=Plakobranchus ocellatus TaxID=259542 RepID=A0AAV4D1L4_9GAST|nr:myosin-10 [Plakobranchus ocellatus]